MGILTNNYIPTINRSISTTYSGHEYVTADKKGKLVYSNNDEFIFISHDGTEVTLSEITSPILSSTIDFSSAEIQAGITKTLLAVPASGYTNNVLGIYFYFYPGTVEYSGSTYLTLNHSVEGVSTLITNYNIQTSINNTLPKVIRYDSSNALTSDLSTSYTVTCPATADGNGTIRATIYYIVVQIA